MVIDEAGRVLAPRIEALGMRCVAVPTLRTDDAAKAALARATLEAASQVRRG